MVVISLETVTLILLYIPYTNIITDPQYWVSNIFGTAIGAGATLVGYVLRRHGEYKEISRRMASSIQREIVYILNEVNDTTRTAIRIRPYHTIERLPTETYDGLLNSAEISRFDIDIQDELYVFYNLFKNKPFDAIQTGSIRLRAITVSEHLDNYIRQNRARLKIF